MLAHVQSVGGLGGIKACRDHTQHFPLAIRKVFDERDFIAAKLQHCSDLLNHGEGVRMNVFVRIPEKVPAKLLKSVVLFDVFEVPAGSMPAADPKRFSKALGGLGADCLFAVMASDCPRVSASLDFDREFMIGPSAVQLPFSCRMKLMLGFWFGESVC